MYDSSFNPTSVGTFPQDLSSYLTLTSRQRSYVVRRRAIHPHLHSTARELRSLSVPSGGAYVGLLEFVQRGGPILLRWSDDWERAALHQAAAQYTCSPGRGISEAR